MTDEENVKKNKIKYKNKITLKITYIGHKRSSRLPRRRNLLKFKSRKRLIQQRYPKTLRRPQKGHK